MQSRISIAWFLLICSLPFASCGGRSKAFVIALSDPISTIDPIGSPTVDAASERVRVLMFNSLVRKNEKFDYVPELATFQISEDGLSVTFSIHDGVSFHDQRQLTSADAKYTFDTLLASNSGKSASFFEGSGNSKLPYISGVEAPDPRTFIIRLRKPWPPLLSNLVPIAIIPKDSAATQKDHPVGSGPFKFVRYDTSQQVLDLEANAAYWEGAPQIKDLRVRVISDANALQAELRSGRVDIAPSASNLSPDTLAALKGDPNLQVLQFTGANVVYLGFNTQAPMVNNVRIRQAIAYSIDRESIIRDLLLGQGQLANSILPETSWAYTSGHKYAYDPQRAKTLLDETGMRDPGNGGSSMRLPQKMVFSISGSNAATKSYAGVIQNYLAQVGIPAEIETLETNTLFERLRNGQFQMTTSRWIGGNQDPIFFRDLFESSEIPSQDRAGKNRSRYSNRELDNLLDEAVNTTDRGKALTLYTRAQDIVSNDLPMLPLWYPANMVVAKKNVGNISLDGSGDWNFVRNLTVSSK